MLKEGQVRIPSGCAIADIKRMFKNGNDRKCKIKSA
jgi:hypothetical protein